MHFGIDKQRSWPLYEEDSALAQGVEVLRIHCSNGFGHLGDEEGIVGGEARGAMWKGHVHWCVYGKTEWWK